MNAVSAFFESRKNLVQCAALARARRASKQSHEIAGPHDFGDDPQLVGVQIRTAFTMCAERPALSNPASRQAYNLLLNGKRSSGCQFLRGSVVSDIVPALAFCLKFLNIKPAAGPNSSAHRHS